MNDVTVDMVHDKLAAVWREQLKCGEVTAESDFFDCGGTSIGAVYLAASIQEIFAVPVDAIEVVTLRTFGKIVDLIHERATAET